ncbi:MAG: AtpZ/AtpI family protein [Hyphomonadaceae bacterium]
MADSDQPPEDDALKDLRKRVAAARGPGVSSTPKAPDSAASLALRFGGEFGAAVLVGAAIGFGIDQFAPTDPWGLVVGLILGFAAGVVNVARTAQAYSRANPVDPNTPPIPEDED